jgi:hypothetical protein
VREQPHADGDARPAHDTRDLLDGQVLGIAQPERRALLLAEDARGQVPQRAPLVASGRRVDGIGDHGHLAEPRLALGTRLAAPRAVRAHRQVLRQRVEPRREAPARVVAHEALPGAQERFLAQVLG